MAAEIFVSYAREDDGRIGPLCRALEEHGWSVFWDRRIPAGKTWREYIGKALADARCVIVAWSSHSLNSRYVMKEADEAERRNVLVPILLDDVEPPFGFRDINAANLTAWQPRDASAEFEQLLNDISEIIGERSAQSDEEMDAAPLPPRQSPTTVTSPPSPEEQLPPPAESAPTPLPPRQSPGAVTSRPSPEQKPPPPAEREPSPRPEVSPLASLIGVAPGPLQWRRALHFGAAVLATGILTALADSLYAQRLDRVLPSLMGQIIHGMAETACILVAFRLVRRKWIAVLAVGVSYSVLLLLLRYLPPFSHGVLSGGMLLGMFLKWVFILGGLILALDRMRSVGKALFVGYLAGSLLSMVSGIGLTALFWESFSYSLDRQLVYVARLLVSAALFAGILLAGRPRGVFVSSDRDS